MRWLAVVLALSLTGCGGSSMFGARNDAAEEAPSRLRSEHDTRALSIRIESEAGSSFLIEHDLVRKPVPTFRDHAPCRRARHGTSAIIHYGRPAGHDFSLRSGFCPDHAET